MDMIKFRVQNYKKIRDTNWINTKKLTAFVGKNEAGKSALFRGLSKLNPSDGEHYNEQKEFPRSRYTSEFKLKDWPVASGMFKLDDKEKEKLIETCSYMDKVDYICCTRYYSWKLDVEFMPNLVLPDTTNNNFISILTQCLASINSLVAPDGKGDQLKSIKDSLALNISPLLNSVSKLPNQQINLQQIENVMEMISRNSNEEWQKFLLQPILNDLNNFKNSIIQASKINSVKQWVNDNIPKFIYFDEYNVIDSAIHIPTFINSLNNNPNDKKMRVIKCLFDHVGLDIKKISELDPNKPNQNNEAIQKMSDERAIQMSSASSAMTQKFSDWWDQRQHKFEYQVDGPSFRVWVSDDFDPSKIELDQRSRGLQYFFSFYVIFLVEASGAYKNSILLLDEPGIYMHGTAQGKLVKFFEKLSETNKTLYTTHSPFMIDGDHLNLVRVVYEDYKDKTTKVTEDI